MAHGGVGDFLFQLDLAKRLELAGIETLFLARRNYGFLSEILKASNVSHARLMRADGVRYLAAVISAWLMALHYKLFIINSFHYTSLRAPTRILYRVAHLLSARIIVCGKTADPHTPYTQLVYGDHELIWQRNNRIVALVSGAPRNESFPVLEFIADAPSLQKPYIHLHPVSSALQKSYPPKKLLATLTALGTASHILLTMTPKEEAWYMTEALRTYISAHPNITFISKQFAFTEIAGHIFGAGVVGTVNTGLMWLALMLGKPLVVCDTHTDFEWNPAPYGTVTRLFHDYDEQGVSLHLVLGEHEDGTYYESMYRVSGEEFAAALQARFAT
jgi:hypothetical protein